MTGEMTIGATGPVMPTGGVAGPFATGAAPATLLPTPDRSIDIDGALGLMMKLSSEICDVQTQSQTEHAKNAAKARKAASELRSEILKRAAEAAKTAAEEKSEGGLFDFIEDDLARIGLVGVVTVAALAATVASGGTAAPAVVAMVGIGISTATQVGQQTGLFREMFGEEAATYVALGGTVLGAALSLGGGIYSVCSASSATKALDDVGKIATAIDGAKTVAEASHSIVQGVRNLRAAELQHDADLMQVEAQRHKHTMEFFNRMIDAVIDDLEGLQESARKATEICQSMSQTHHQTLLLAANFKG
jgi:hypothetical protein